MIGDRNTFSIKTEAGSESTISLHPLWQYSERVIKDKNFYRTQAGRLNSFRKNGTYYEFNLPIDYVSSSDAHTINQWWEDQTDLNFILNENESDQQTITVRLTNLIKPFNTNVRGRPNQFKGNMILRSSTDVGLATQPFTLDDPVFGQLDDDTLG